MYTRNPFTTPKRAKIACEFGPTPFSAFMIAVVSVTLALDCIVSNSVGDTLEVLIAEPIAKQQEDVTKCCQNVTRRCSYNMSSNKDSLTKEIDSWRGFGYALRKENRIGINEEQILNTDRFLQQYNGQQHLQSTP